MERHPLIVSEALKASYFLLHSLLLEQSYQNEMFAPIVVSLLRQKSPSQPLKLRHTGSNRSDHHSPEF